MQGCSLRPNRRADAAAAGSRFASRHPGRWGHAVSVFDASCWTTYSQGQVVVWFVTEQVLGAEKLHVRCGGIGGKRFRKVSRHKGLVPSISTCEPRMTTSPMRLSASTSPPSFSLLLLLLLRPPRPRLRVSGRLAAVLGALVYVARSTLTEAIVACARRQVSQHMVASCA